MYDNLLYQGVAAQLEHDILRDAVPGAMLFAGAAGSGKLTAALETARVLSCRAEPRGEWLCGCASCRRHKMLVPQNMIVAGPRECTPEILAAKKTFLLAAASGAPYLTAARYLYLRSVRKLTARFSPVLLEGDDKISKIAALLSSVDEQLETLDFPHEIPEEKKLEKITSEIEKNCVKLESEFLPDSIPVRQIRNAAAWAHVKSADGKKAFIVENADRMPEGARNALLKILEEPPEDAVFILTATRRNAVMPTILSRVRTYYFETRSLEQQRDVIVRVFHDAAFDGTIEKYFENFLPVAPEAIRSSAREFYSMISEGKIPSVEKIVKDCAGFEPRKLFRIFLLSLQDEMRPLLRGAAGTEAVSRAVAEIRGCMNNVTLYNEQAAAALESLVRSLSRINRTHSLRQA